jgi:hypothetical protein
MLLLAFGISGNLLFAQKDKSVFSTVHEVVGNNELTNVDIAAKKYNFSRRIFSSQIDTTLGVLTVYLRDTTKKSGEYKSFGQILIFDLNADRVLWDKVINYNQEKVRTFGHFLIQSNKGMSEVYYTLAGNKVRDVFGQFVEVYKDKQIGLVIPSDISGDPKKRLMGMSMFTGDKLWERKMDHGYGMNDIFRLNDSVIIIESGGLHAVNLDNGKGWDYEIETGKKNYSASIFGSLAGIMVGVLTRGSVAFYVIGHNTRNIHSNMIVSDTAIYMAGRNELVRLDTEGNVVWKNELAENVVTMSAIFIENGILYMINSGEVGKNGRSTRKQGYPFFAAFDVNTGKQEYLTLFEKGGVFTGYEVKDNSVVLLEKDGVQAHALADQTILAEKNCDTTVHGELLRFVGKKIYTERGDYFDCLADLDSSWVNIYTSKHQVLTMNTSLEVLKETPWNDFYLCYAEKDGYKFLLKDGKTIVIDRQNRKVANIDVDDNSVIVGHTLYNISKTTYSVIDLSSVMTN